MKNWSGKIQWNPSQIAYPESEEAIQELVFQALQENKKIRTIGAGHSFNPLWTTDQILVSLDKYQGLVSVDAEKMQATIKGGTRLYKLGDLLFEKGMAMENLGDIDRQSIAGTISTGTHGTGINFGTISTQVRAIRFINGKGEIVQCSLEDQPELFKAAQVSLGALGIITEITLQCVPAYRLALVSKKEALSDVLQSFQKRIEQHRNFEFYWFPKADKVWTKTANIATDEVDKRGLVNYISEYLIENYAFKVLCEFARFFPSMNDAVSRISVNSIPNVRKVFHSHKVYATPRLVRFNEMEYNVPLAAYQDVFKAIRQTINRGKFNVHFPIENRVVKGDDIYLSPAFGRDSAYIACHVYNKKDYKAFFKELEVIFLAHEGRPHWGKIHTLKGEELAKRYPHFGDFLYQRALHDPMKIFLNDYLKELFGLDFEPGPGWTIYQNPEQN